MKEIDRLTALGYKVKVSHLRFANPKMNGDEIHILTQPMNVYQLKQRGFEPAPFGGITGVRLTAPNGVEFKERVVVSPQDRYEKRVGVKVALDRIALGRFAESGQVAEQ